MMALEPAPTVRREEDLAPWATRPSTESSILPRLAPVAAVWRRLHSVGTPRADRSLGGGCAQSRGLGRIAALRSPSCTRDDFVAKFKRPATGNEFGWRTVF